MNINILKKSTRQFGLPTFVGSILITAIVMFVLGTRFNGVLLSLEGGQNKGLPTTLNLSPVQDVYDKLRSEFDGKLDAQALIEGAKKGLVEAAGDPYTVYFTDAEAKQFMSSLDGTFSGIGAELDKSNGHLIIVSTLDDSPALKAGLLPNDVILKVNDQDISTWSIDQAVAQIRGPKGTTVKLSIARGQQLMEFTITRDDLVSPSAKYQELDGNIGYLRISRFAPDTSGIAQKAAAEFASKHVSGVILDLRGDGGGYLTAAQDVASLWLPAGKTIVQERRGTQVVETLSSLNPTPPLAGLPTVVLVDGSSASASEIVAGALHDNGAARLVGQRTFGKGSVQNIDNLSSSGELKVTIAKWYTPNGKNINKQGIDPDVQVQISDDDTKNNRDPQKDKAIELLQK